MITESNQRIATIFIFLLAFTGGLYDVSSFLTLGVFSGHLTGNTVTSLVYLIQGQYTELYLSLTALSGFISGSFIGIIWRKRIKCQQQIYQPLIAMFLLILFAITLFKSGSNLSLTPFIFIFSVSCALGIQNGVYTNIFNIKIHTSYITGTSTSWFEALLYVDKTDTKALFHRKISLTIIIAFISGVTTAAILYHFINEYIFFAGLCFIFISTLFCRRYANIIF